MAIRLLDLLRMLKRTLEACAQERQSPAIGLRELGITKLARRGAGPLRAVGADITGDAEGE
jgi:hypothetical protein